jgi:hypothetical protein
MHLFQETACLVRVFGSDQYLDLTEPVKGETVGLAERFAAGGGRNTVGAEKRSHLALFDLALRRKNGGPFVIHRESLTQWRVDSLRARCYAPLPPFRGVVLCYSSRRRRVGSVHGTTRH